VSTFGELIADASKRLEACSSSAQLDATLLLAHVLETSKLELLCRMRTGATARQAEAFQNLVLRRSDGEPVAYIIGEKEFWGITFRVTPDVLIPRPETELLVQEALQLIGPAGQGSEILELGTGSGCISVALACELRGAPVNARILAVERSAAALAVARENAARNKVADRIEFREGDWFSGLAPAKQFDIIVSNPPYIAQGDRDVSPETRFEPQAALYGGIDGLEALRSILSEAPPFLKRGACLICEIGSTQQRAIEEYLKTIPNYYHDVTFLDDLAGHSRVVRAFGN